MIDDSETYQTIFGTDYSVRVYATAGQHENHISILVHENKVKEIKDFICKKVTDETLRPGHDT